MAINVSMSGSGEIGDIKPGWSVTESATPVTIGENASSAGSVSISAGEKETSAFIVNNNATTQHDELGVVSGTVNGVNVQGATVSFSHSTALDKFNAEKNIPAVVSGDAHSAMDLCLQLVGENRLRSDLGGWYGSLAGHNALFYASGEQVYGNAYYAKYNYYNSSTGTTEEATVNAATDSIFSSQHRFVDGKMYAFNEYGGSVVGDSFHVDPTIANVQYLAYRVLFKDFTGGDFTTFNFNAGPDDPDTDNGFYGSVYVYPTAVNPSLNVEFYYFAGGTPSSEVASVPLPDIELDKEYFVFIKYSFELSEVDGGVNKYYLTASIAPVDNVGNYVSASANIFTFFEPTWYSEWNLGGLVRSVWRDSNVISNDAVETQGPLLRQNMMANPSFESALGGLKITAKKSAGTSVGVTSTQDSTTKVYGTKSLKNVMASSFNNFEIKSSLKFPVKEGNLYSVSAYAKTSSASAGTDWANEVGLVYFDSSGNEITSINSSGYAGIGLGTSWERLTTSGFSIPVGYDIAYAAFYYFGYNDFGADVSQTLWFDAILIEKISFSDIFNEPAPYFDASIPSITTIRKFETISTGISVSSEYEIVTTFSEVTPFAYDNEPLFVDSITRIPVTQQTAMPPAIGIKTNMWEYLQAACSAHGQEIAVINNVITLRDAGSVPLSIDNVVPSPTLEVSSTLAGRAVDIVYTNAEIFSPYIISYGNEERAVAYDAFKDNNKVITVNPNEVATVSLTSNIYSTSIFNPQRAFELPNPIGKYIVSDADGLPFPIIGTINLNVTAASGSGTVATITTKQNHGLKVNDTVTIYGVSPKGYNGTYTVTAVSNARNFQFASTMTAPLTKAGKAKYTTKSTLWEDYGGKVEASINRDTPGTIDVKITGPYIEIPGYKAPYKLAAVADGADYAALSITGRGIRSTPETLHLQTGISHERVNQEIAKTINNPFIATKEQAYDRGMYASIDASGPRVTLSGQIPTSAIDGFGLTAGSVFEYRNSKFRVTEATISNIGVSFTAVRHVMVGDFDSKWNTKTAIYHDSIWSELEMQDQIVTPFYGLDLNNGVVRFDTDGNPYLSTVRDSEIVPGDWVTYKKNLATNPGFEEATTVPQLYRENLVVDPNLGYGFPWIPVLDCSATITSTIKYTGDDSMRLRRRSTFGAIEANYSPIERIPVEGGKIYTFSVWVYSTVSAPVSFGWTEYDSGGAVVTTYVPSPPAVPANTWKKITGTKTLASTTVSIAPKIITAQSFDTTDSLYIDTIVIEKIPVFINPSKYDFFDGSTADGDFTYSWSGRIGDSTSLATINNPKGVTGNNCFVAQSTEWSASGTKSLRIIPNSSSNASYARVTVSTVVGKKYTIKVKMRLAATLTGVLSSFNKGIYITSPSGGGGGVRTNSNVAGVYEFKYEYIANNTTTYIQLHNGASFQNGDVWFDDLIVAEGPYIQGRIDGDAEDGATFKYEWDGTPNDSTTTVYRNEGYFSLDGQAAILIDTDGSDVPYYVPISGGSGPTLLELDTDFTPYYS